MAIVGVPFRGMLGLMDVEEVAGQLYGLPPAEFTAARDACASEARHAGEAALATSIKRLRKPTVAAWLANLLVRERRADVDRLVGLGAALRKGQAGVEGEQIRRASKERGDVVAALLRAARSIASRADRSVSDAVARDLEDTLDAAFADPASGEALLSGQLAVALRYSGLGFGPEAARGAPSFPSASKSATSSAELRKAKQALTEATKAADRADAETDKARRAVETAERHLADLKSAAAVADREAKDARERARGAQKKVDRLS